MAQLSLNPDLPKQLMKDEIVLYRPDELNEHIEVRIEEETVWLSLNQIAKLFERDKSVISRHLSNIYKEGELIKEATVAKIATVQMEAGRKVTREIEYYNLDAIISVGYRVNSKKGTQFRIWATRVLKDYLLKGYAINSRISQLENNFENLKSKVDQIDLQISSHLIPTQGVFFDGQVFDAYELASKIIRSAKYSIVLIDNYLDENTLIHLTKKQANVKVQLLTKSISNQLKLDIKKANEQYGNFEIRTFTLSHDRFLIIDGKEVYHLGASLKDLGKKWFAFSKMDAKSVEGLLNQLRENQT
ncbi:Virulence protein RhuM family protein [Algoriphagus faecimaris]|uniref:Virulence protein RhuM family protein n=1 Tax=Algoriphagus faecimaris TaxID=686796 RepID=A0A1G6Y400_9BACT|nr:RhuM family protein [Algoriphagus faecimaris]SDD85214.1 Virulence protein RhuM family protein [Algoriphagus faecimaris]